MKIIYAQVTQDSTVLQMKQKIHRKTGIPIHQMQLSYNDRPLEDDLPLSYYSVRNATNLSLKIYSREGDCPCADCKRMQKKVIVAVKQFDGTVIKVEAILGQPVESLKNAVREIRNIPVSRQRLVYNNQTLEDHKLLDEYKLVDEENGEEEPVVNLLIEGGPPTFCEKLAKLMPFQGARTTATT